MKTIPTIVVFASLAILIAAAAAQSETNEVYFLHRTNKKSMLQLNCDEEKNGYAQPIYTCYHQGNKPITLGPEWRLVKVKDVCFRHKVRDTINACIQIVEPKKRSPSYVCLYGKENRFFLPSDKWEKINANDSRCQDNPRKPRELIRGDGSSSNPSEIEWSEDDAAQD
jgi:hypothetical protein